MKKKNKSNKRFILIIVAIVIIIAIIAVVVSGNKDRKENNGDLNKGNPDQVTNSQNEHNDNSGNGENNVSDPNSIPEKNTTSVGNYVDESGKQLEEEKLKEAKENIITAFKAVPKEKLGIDVDLESARIMFNQGITTISDSECFVFNVYIQKDDGLVNSGMFAMSRDTNILYKFNSQSMTYDLIEK